MVVFSTGTWGFHTSYSLLGRLLFYSCCCDVAERSHFSEVLTTKEHRSRRHDVWALAVSSAPLFAPHGTLFPKASGHNTFEARRDYFRQFSSAAERPYIAARISMFIALIAKGTPSHKAAELALLFRGMLEVDPARRLTIAHVLAHPIVRGELSRNSAHVPRPLSLSIGRAVETPSATLMVLALEDDDLLMGLSIGPSKRGPAGRPATRVASFVDRFTLQVELAKEELHLNALQQVQNPRTPYFLWLCTHGSAMIPDDLRLTPRRGVVVGRECAHECTCNGHCTISVDDLAEDFANVLLAAGQLASRVVFIVSVCHFAELLQVTQ